MHISSLRVGFGSCIRTRTTRGCAALRGRCSGACPLPLPYLAALSKADVGESTERRAIQFAKDPAKAVAHRGRDAAAAKSRRATTSYRNTPQQTKYLPVAPPSRPGEIHEAKIGFRALMNKAEKSEDMDKSRAYRLVAFQHFKFLLNQSTLPALMEMSADEIIELVRKI
jgi:hypothetical protein